MGGADHARERLPRQVDVVGIAALAAEQPRVLLAVHRLADTELEMGQGGVVHGSGVRSSGALVCAAGQHRRDRPEDNRAAPPAGSPEYWPRPLKCGSLHARSHKLVGHRARLRPAAREHRDDLEQDADGGSGGCAGACLSRGGHRPIRPARGHAFGSQDRRSDLDHGLHQPQLRLPGLRHAVRAGRAADGPAADGRFLRDQRRQSDLHLHAARRAARGTTASRSRRGRDRLDRALGREGQHGPAADVVRRRHEGDRRADLRDAAQGALRPGPPVARQAELERALHHAQADRRDAGLRADLGIRRLRPVRVRARRVGAGQQGGVHQVRGLQAAQRAAVLGRRRQGRQGRPGRVALDPGHADRGQRADQRRDRRDRVARRTISCRSSRPTTASCCSTTTRSATSTCSA